jgi:hypothetical protein
MDESLKAFQLIHRGLIGVAAALLVFIVSPDRTAGPYQAALVEFKTLRTVMPKVRQAREDEENDAYSHTQLAAAVRAEASSRHISVDKIEYSPAVEESDFQFMPPMYYANSKQPIDDLYNYIKTAPGFDSGPIYGFDDSDLRKAVGELMDHAGRTITTLYFGLLVDKKYKQVPGQCTLSILLPNPHGTESNRFYQVGPINCHTEKRFKFERAVAILRDAKLFEEQDGYILPLPAISKVWDDVAGKDMNVVEGILERRTAAERSATEGTVSVLGLSLNARVVGILGPILELLIILYLFAHVRHICSLKGSDPDKVRSFPDVGISSGTPGTVLILCTLVVFPLITADLVIIRSFPDVKLRTLLLSVFSLLWLTISLVCVAAIKRLRN